GSSPPRYHASPRRRTCGKIAFRFAARARLPSVVTLAALFRSEPKAPTHTPRNSWARAGHPPPPTTRRQRHQRKGRRWRFSKHGRAGMSEEYPPNKKRANPDKDWL